MGRGRIDPEEGGWPTAAPSAVAWSNAYPAPKALSPEEMDGIKSRFVASAARAHRTGIDQIELHCAHGYLLHEYLAPITNRRDDDYGGSLENRMPFASRPATLLDVSRLCYGFPYEGRVR